MSSGLQVLRIRILLPCTEGQEAFCGPSSVMDCSGRCKAYGGGSLSRRNGLSFNWQFAPGEFTSCEATQSAVFPPIG